MTRSCLAGVLCALFAFYFVACSVYSAEPASSPVKLTLHPSSQPQPALKYRLLPSRMDQIPGNAAVDYGKVTAEEMTFFNFRNRALWDKIEDVWQEMPLEQLKREHIIFPSSSIYFLEQGARRKYCDWQLPIGDIPFYTMLLPEAQQSRSYARMLAVKARREIAEGKFDDAVKTFQANFALGRNVAEGETLVNGLIGIAISGIMFPQMLEFVQQPDSPNLYWALTTLPSPLIEIRGALDVERMGVELSFPELRDIRTANRTPDAWQEMFHRLAKEILTQISTTDSPKPPSPEELDELCRQKLPMARKALIAAGTPAAEVDAMSMHQVALLYMLQAYHELVDNAIKYYYLPYPEASAGINAVIERSRQEQREIIPVAASILPAIQVTRSAVMRNDREIAVLRVIEALRIYAAEHDGDLPQQLSDVTQVPIADDPVTGKPFNYRREADKAVLQGPTFRDVPLDYEITMAKPN